MEGCHFQFGRQNCILLQVKCVCTFNLWHEFDIKAILSLFQSVKLKSFSILDFAIHLQPQFYLQFLYKPHFGQLWVKKKWVVLSFFWGWFFQFFVAKKRKKIISSSALKSRIISPLKRNFLDQNWSER